MGSPEHSVTELFERYGPTVYRRCRQLVGDGGADDAVQEVFLRATRAWDRFQGDCSPMTWLYRIATTHCLQQLRNDRSRAAKLELLLPPEGTTEDMVAKLDVAGVLSELDDLTQQLVVLRHLDGMTLEEVAEVAGVSRKTVQKRLDRFKETARRRLAVTEAGT